MAHVKVTALFTTAFFLIAAGTVANGWQMYFMAAVLLALPVASLAIGRVALHGLSAAREVPSPAWSGDITSLALRIRASGWWPRMFLEARDVLPRLIRRTDDAPLAFDIAPGGEATLRYDVEPLKRGAYRLRHVLLTARDPMGLFAFTKRIPADGELIVYPTPEAVPGFTLSGADRYGYRDLPRAAARGSGIDPDGVREYIPGDPLRRMHWKTVARTGDLHVIEFEEARSVDVVLLLDCYAGSVVGEDLDTNFEYLVRAAASIAEEAIRQQASVRLSCMGDGGIGTGAGRGTDHLLSILAALARVEPLDPGRLAQRVSARLGPLPAGTTLVVLTGDDDPALGETLAQYVAADVRVIVVCADRASFARTAPMEAPSHGEAPLSFLSAGAEVYAIGRSEGRRLLLDPVRGAHALA